MSNSDSETSRQSHNFGSILRTARKSKKYSITEVSEYLKIPEQVITAIEENDLDVLPPPTFTQGYIRAYAKYLGIPEQEVLKIYNIAVPHDETAELRSRSTLPVEANSQLPIMRAVTVLLVIIGIAAVVIGSYQYYDEKAGVMESELVSGTQSFTGTSLNSPGLQRLEIKQQASLTEDDTLVLDDSAEISDEVPVIEEQAQAEPDVDTSAPAALEDIVEVYAENGSWLEVYDASDERLFYNMVPVGGRKTLLGQGPFRFNMGNASTTRIVINDTDVDFSSRTRRNNTASFTVSVEDQKVIFH